MEHQAKIENRLIASLSPYANNARTHSKKQLAQIAASIKRFGFTNPVLVAEDGRIIAGHGRVQAAKLLGHTEVPAIVLSHLSDAERRAYILADNKLALNAGWDREILAIELQFLTEIDFDLDSTGFSVAEIDLTLDFARSSDAARPEPLIEDAVIPLQKAAITEIGDVWQLGRHVLACGDARNKSTYEALTCGELIDLIFADVPYNCKINGHARGPGKSKFREFPMASGEMADSEFVNFLKSSLSLAAATCRDGAIAYIFMDWRGMESLLAAGKHAFTEMKQLCVWNKPRGGMGTFYRSKHELIFVYKVGSAKHVNNFGLGETGRYRTNVWDYPGVLTAEADLEDHPTPKPVALVADAIRDCTKRGDLILDNFAGSGTTLIAAETCGRSARLIELDPLYCDSIIRRFEKYTGKKAVHKGSERTFEDVTESRLQSISESDS